MAEKNRESTGTELIEKTANAVTRRKTETNIGVDVALNKDDVVCIAVDAAMRRLKKEFDEAKKEHTATTGAINDANEELKKVCDIDAQSHVVKLESIAKVINEQYDMELKVVYSISTNTVQEQDAFVLSLCIGNLSIKKRDVPYNRKARALRETINLLIAEQTKLDNEMMLLKKSLANRFGIEQTYKAKVARAQLAKTAEGQDLLTALDVNVNWRDDILGLNS